MLSNPTIAFLIDSPDPVHQGNALALTADTVVDADGDTIVSVDFYRSTDAAFDAGSDTLLGSGVLSGLYDWQWTGVANWTAGNWYYFAVATNDVPEQSAPAMSAGKVNALPVVSWLTGDPEPISPGDVLTLTATGVTDPDGSVQSVDFYHDVNDDGLWDVGDTFLERDSDGLDGWSVDRLVSWTTGGYFARARDNDGAFSTATYGTVDQKPTIGALTNAPNPIIQGQWVTFTASNVADSDGTVTNVAFYRDVFDSGHYNPGLDIWMGDGTDAGGGNWDLTVLATWEPDVSPMYFAIAQDDASPSGLWGDPVWTVNQNPSIDEVTPDPNPVALGSPLDLVAYGVTDSDGFIQDVWFSVHDRTTNWPENKVPTAEYQDSSGVDGWNWAVPVVDWQITDVVKADFNQDGHMDLAVTVDVTSTAGVDFVSVLTNNGFGTFLATSVVDLYAVNVGANYNPQAIAAADFNNDGYPDLATADYGDPFAAQADADYTLGHVSVLLNDQTGQFVTHTDFDVDFRSNRAVIHPDMIAAADYTGDGNVDLFLGSSRDNEMPLLLGDGTGAFTLDRIYSYGTSSAPPPAALGLLDMVTADLDFNEYSPTDIAMTGFNGPFLLFNWLRPGYVDPFDPGNVIGRAMETGLVGGTGVDQIVEYDWAYRTGNSFSNIPSRTDDFFPQWLHFGDVDFYHLNAAQGHFVTVTMTRIVPPGANTAPGVFGTLYDDQGLVAGSFNFSDDNGDVASFGFGASGEYFLAISGFDPNGTDPMDPFTGYFMDDDEIPDGGGNLEYFMLLDMPAIDLSYDADDDTLIYDAAFAPPDIGEFGIHGQFLFNDTTVVNGEWDPEEDVWLDGSDGGLANGTYDEEFQIWDGGDATWDTAVGTTGLTGLILFYDADSDGFFDYSEEVWADVGTTTGEYDGGDTQIWDGGDAVWTTAATTAGIPGNVFWTDHDSTNTFTALDEVWSDARVLALRNGQYDAIQETRVYTGASWTAEDGDAGIYGRMLFRDDQIVNGEWDAEEDVWVDGLGGGLVNGTYDEEFLIWDGGNAAWDTLLGTVGVPGLALFADLNLDGFLSQGEEVWADVGVTPGSYDGGDIQVWDGGDASWDTAATTAGIAGNVYVSDLDINGIYTGGDEVWSDPSSTGLSNGLYDGIQEPRISSGASWTTWDGDRGVHGPVLFSDTAVVNGRWDSQEDVWVDGSGGGLMNGTYDEEFQIWDGGDGFWQTPLGAAGLWGLVRFEDTDADTYFDYTEEVWADVGVTPGSYDASDLQIWDGGDTVWSTSFGAGGIPGNLYVTDLDLSTTFTSGDEVWSDPRSLALQNGLYNGIQETRLSAGAAWTTEDGDPGIVGDLVWYDVNSNGLFDTVDFVWADGPNYQDGQYGGNDSLVYNLFTGVSGIHGDVYYYDADQDGTWDAGEDLWADTGFLSGIYDPSDTDIFDTSAWDLVGGEIGSQANVLFYDLDGSGTWDPGELIWSTATAPGVRTKPLGAGDSITFADFMDDDYNANRLPRGELLDIDLAVSNPSTGQVAVLFGDRIVGWKQRDAYAGFFAGVYRDTRSHEIAVPRVPTSITAYNVDADTTRDTSSEPDWDWGQGSSGETIGEFYNDLIITNTDGTLTFLINDAEHSGNFGIHEFASASTWYDPDFHDWDINYELANYMLEGPLQHPMAVVGDDFDGDGIQSLAIVEQYGIAMLRNTYPFHQSDPLDLDQYEAEWAQVGLSFDFQSRYSVVTPAQNQREVTYYAIAFDEDYGWPDNLQYEGYSPTVSVDVLLNQMPTIWTLTGNREALEVGDGVTLTANGVQDADGFVKAVEFYLDDGFVPGMLDVGDMLLGVDLNGAGGWTWAGTLGATSDVFWARALDEDDDYSRVVGTMVNTRPTIGSLQVDGVFYATDDELIVGLAPLDDTPGYVTNVLFFDANVNNRWDAGEELWEDANDNGFYDEESLIWDGGNAAWDTVPGTSGVSGVALFTDFNYDDVFDWNEGVFMDDVVSNGVYDTGETVLHDGNGAWVPQQDDAGTAGNVYYNAAFGEVWADASRDPGDTAGQYDGIQEEHIHDGSDGTWDTGDAFGGTLGNLLSDDATLNGVYDAGEAVWAEAVEEQNSLALMAVDVGGGANSPDSRVYKVQIYRDSDFNGVFDPKLDYFMGRAVNAGNVRGGPADEYVLNVPAVDWGPGSHKYFAVVQDYYDGWSGTAAARNHVVNLPPTISGLIDTPDPVTQGDMIALSALGVEDPFGEVHSVEFYLDVWDEMPIADGSDGWDTPALTAGLSGLVLFDDAVANASFDYSEEVWVDLDASGTYSALDVQIWDGGDASWDTVFATAGIAGNVYLADLDTSGTYTSGDEVWADVSGTPGVYDARLNIVYDGIDAGDMLLGVDSSNAGGWNWSGVVTWAAGPHTYMARVIDNYGAITDPSTDPDAKADGDVNLRPTIGSLIDAPDPVFQTYTLTLTAGTVADSDGTVADVKFYRDSNASGALEVGVDDELDPAFMTPLGGGAWQWQGVADWPVGDQMYFARAQDNDSGYSVAAFTTGRVANLRPVIGGLTLDVDPVTEGNPLTLIAENVIDGNGTIGVVEFWRDANGNGNLDLVGDQWLADVYSAETDDYSHSVTVGWAPGLHLYFARARDNDLVWSDVAFAQGFVNGRPEIAALTATPDPLVPGDVLTLEATGVTDPDGSIKQVAFYRDSNADGVFQEDLDALLDNDTDEMDGWTLSQAEATGVGTYFARAQDDRDGWSLAASVTLGWVPTIGGLTDAPDPVHRGQVLVLTATDVMDIDGTIDQVRFYRDADADGELDPEIPGVPGGDTPLGTDTTLGDGWFLALAPTWEGGTHTYFAHARDNEGNWSPSGADAPSTVGYVDFVPVIAGLTDAPDPVTRGQSLTLTATGVTDADSSTGTAEEVEFYRDVNGNGTFEDGTDALLDRDTSDAGGWTVTVPTLGWNLGAQTYFARAQDDAGAWSDPVSTTGELNGPPLIGSLNDTPDPVIRGQNLTLTALGVNDPDGLVLEVHFYHDANANGTWDGADTWLDFDDDGTDGWILPGIDTTGYTVGAHVYFARAQDDVGAWGAAATAYGTVTTAPAVTILLATGSDTGISNSDGITFDSTPDYDVIVNDAGTLEIDWDGDGTFDYFPPAVTLPGSYTYTGNFPVDGPYTTIVRFTDSGLNVATDSVDVVIDTLAPSGPVPPPDLQAGSDNGASNTDNITSNTSPTFDVAPTDTYFRFYRDLVQFSADYETGTTYTAVGGGLGQPLPHTYDFAYQAYDAAGNFSAPSGPRWVQFVSGPAAPAAPDLQAGSDSGSSSTDDVTNAAVLVFDVTSTDVSFRFYRSGTLISGVETGTTYAAAAEPEGTWDYTVTAWSAGGTESNYSPALTVTVDRTAPTVTTANIAAWLSVDGGTVGVAEIGDVLTVTWNNSLAGDGNADVASVGVNLSRVAGPTDATMYDDGTHGDVIAGDGLYTLDYTIGTGTLNDAPGVWVSATDVAGNEETLYYTTGIGVETKLLSLWQWGGVKVAIYDVDGNSDVDPANIKVKLGGDSEIKSIKIGGEDSAEGLGIAISGASYVKSIKDSRKGDPGELAFIVSDSPIGSISLKTGLTGHNINGETLADLVLPADIDGDGDTDDPTAIYSEGYVGKVKARGTIDGDVVIAGTSGGYSLKRLDLKNGGFSGDMVLAGNAGKIKLGGDLDWGSSIGVAGSLDALELKGQDSDIWGQVRIKVGGLFKSLKVNGHITGGAGEDMAQILASDFGKIDIRGYVSRTRILAGADLGDDWAPGGADADADTFGQGSIGRLKIRGEGANYSVTRSTIAAGLVSTPAGAFDLAWAASSNAFVNGSWIGKVDIKTALSGVDASHGIGAYGVEKYKIDGSSIHPLVFTEV